jgi:hypothetical protein
VVRPGGGHRSGVPVVPAAVPARTVPGRLPGPVTATAEHPLPPVPGIGPARLELLVKYGVATAERVVRLGSDGLRRVLPGLPHAVATALIDEARRAIAQGDGSR